MYITLPPAISYNSALLCSRYCYNDENRLS